MANIGVVEGTLRLRDEFSAALTRASKQLEQHGGRMEAVGRRMSNVGGQLSRTLTLPMVAAGGAALKLAIDLNEGMANVATLIPGNTARVADLRTEIQGLSVDVGKVTGDLTSGLYQVISAFGDTADTVEVLEINARAATAGLSTTLEAIDLTSAVTKGYGDTSAEAVQKAADLALMTVRLGQTTFPDLAASMGRVIPLAEAVGQSQEDMFAVFATATGVVGGAAEVATQYRGIINALLKPTAELSKLIAEQGFASGEAMLRSMGLVDTLGLIGATAKETGKPITEYITQIEAVPLALALAGPQADVFREKLRQMGEAAGATDAAFREQTEGVNAAGFALKQARAELEVALQQLGQELLPTLTTLLGALRPVVGVLEGMASALAAMPAPVRGATLALVGLAAAAGPVLFISGQLITSWGTLAATAPKLAAGIAKVASQLLVVNPILVITLGLLVALNKAVKIWGERSSAAMAKIVADTNRVGAAVADLRKGLQEGEISAGALERAREVAAALGDEIGRVGREINKKNAEMENLSADALVLQREEVAKLEKEFARLGVDRSNLERFIQLASKLPVILEEAEEGAEGAAGPPGGITQLSDALRDALKSIADTTAEQKALLAALADSQEAYDILNVLLGAGVPLADALTGAHNDLARKYLEVTKTLEGLIAKRERANELAALAIKLEDELNKAIQETIDTAASGDIRFEIPLFDPDSLGGITKGAEAVGAAVKAIREEEQRRAEALAEINRRLEVGLITLEEARQLTEEMNIETNAMAEALETMMKRAWENIQDAASDAISGIFDDLIDTGNDTLDQLLKSFADMLAQLLVMWAANAAKRAAMEQGVVASGGGGGGGSSNWFNLLKRFFGMGGGAGGFSSGVGAAGNAAFGGGTGAMTNAYWSQYTSATATGISQGIGGASWGTIGAMFGTAAAAIIVAEMGNAWVAGQKQKLTAGTVRFGPDEMSAFAGDGGLNQAMVDSLHALQDMFRELEILTGASLDILDQVVINVKGNNRIWVNIGDWFSQEVASMEEALDLVVTQLVQRSNVVGGSPAIRAALENFTGNTVDELNAAIAAALRSEELLLGTEGAAAIRQKTAEFFTLLQKEIELELIEAQGGSGALTGLVQSYQQNFDRLMGITRDAGEVARQEARAHNAALAMDRARLEMMRAEILATGAVVQAGGGFVNTMVAGAKAMHAGTIATGGMAQATAAGAQVAAAAGRVQAGLGEVMAAGAQAAGANAQAQGALAETQAAGAQVAVTAAQAHAAALDAINEALALLEGLDVDIEAAAAAARRAGSGGGTRKSDMEALRDLLDQMQFDRLLAGMTELEAGLARLEREYQDNLERAHGNAELVARLTEEYRLQEEQLRRNIQLSAVDKFQDFMGIGSDPFSQLQEGFEGASQAVEDAGFGAERTARMLRRLNRAYEVQLDLLSRQTFVSIGDGLMGLLERYYGGVEGFEDFRMTLEQMRFELELANLRLQFEILKASGSLSEAVLARMAEVFDFIDANPIDWGKFVTPDLPAVDRVNDSFRETNNLLEEMARRLASAQEGIRDFLLSLQRGDLGGRSNEEMFNAALAQFEELAAQPGNIQAQEDFPEVARRLAEIARERFGSTDEFQKILDMIEGTGLDFLDVTRVQEDNVVFDQRFLDAQRTQLDVDRKGHESVAKAVRDGFGGMALEEERSREDILQALRELRQEQSALNNRLAAIEARRRTERAA